jgi:hypothetical protein
VGAGSLLDRGNQVFLIHAGLEKLHDCVIDERQCVASSYLGTEEGELTRVAFLAALVAPLVTSRLVAFLPAGEFSFVGEPSLVSEGSSLSAAVPTGAFSPGYGNAPARFRS